MKRIAVLGTSGSGKSTVATQLAQRLGLAYTQLDAIAHGPNWTPVEPDEFRARVAEVARAERWIFDGNYLGRMTDTVWPLADTVVWLDLPLRIVLPRIVRRSVRRIITREELWNGNRERWSGLFGRDSLLSWPSAHTGSIPLTCHPYWQVLPVRGPPWCGCARSRRFARGCHALPHTRTIRAARRQHV